MKLTNYWDKYTDMHSHQNVKIIIDILMNIHCSFVIIKCKHFCKTEAQAR